jgi:hypothetical protein
MSETIDISGLSENLNMISWHFSGILGTTSQKKCDPESMIIFTYSKNPTS